MTRSQTCSRWLNWLPLTAIGVLAFALASAQEVALAQTRASDGAQLSQRLERPVTITWQGQELAAALERLAESQQIPIWIDRRIDPSKPVELSATNQPLREALTSALAPNGWAASPYHGVLYIGPEQTARELPTVSALARRAVNRAPAEIRSKWLRAEASSYPRLSEPRALLGDLTKSIGAQLRGDQLIPHDLWAARTLPPMATIDRVVLLLAGFDLTCEISPDGRDCTVVSIKRPVQIASAYTVSAARAAAVNAVLKKLPEAKATRRGTKLTLLATIEEHERVRAAIQAKPAMASTRPAPRPANRNAQRFTLKITNQPVGPAMDQLARQLKLNIDWAAPAEARITLISCEVSEATLDELLTAVLSAAELEYTRDGDAITITRAK